MANKTIQLQNREGDILKVDTAASADSLSAGAGSSTVPVYIDSNGAPAQITSYSGKANTAGTADVATKLGTATKGSSTQPIYLNAGVPTAISSYSGTASVANKLGTSTVGSSSIPIYLNAGTGTAVSSIHVNGDVTSGTATWTQTPYCGAINNKNNAYLAANNDGNLYAGMYHTKSTGYGSNCWITYINTSGSISRNTTSDRRIKDEIGKMSDQEAHTLLSNVNIINFIYKNDDRENIQSGIYTQELRDILIDNEIGYRSSLIIMDNSNNESNQGQCYYDLNHDENSVLYGIDYSKLVPVLIKGWQIHEDKINEYE